MIYNMTLRLQALLECMGKCKVLADIGTDHAYLPIEACRKNLCEKAIACDIAAGPLKIARANIKEAALENRVETRLGDGLLPLGENEADCIVIAGMGGKRIIEILEKEPKKAGLYENAKLILQAQHDLEELRRFLHSQMYNILEERLVRERGKFYVIIVAKKEIQRINSWSDAEYFLGKIANSQELLSYYQDTEAKIRRYINSISNEIDRKTAETRLEWLQVRYKCLKEEHK